MNQFLLILLFAGPALLLIISLIGILVIRKALMVQI